MSFRILTRCCNPDCGKPLTMIWVDKDRPTKKQIAEIKVNSPCARCARHASVVGQERRLSFAK